MKNRTRWAEKNSMFKQIESQKTYQKIYSERLKLLECTKNPFFPLEPTLQKCENFIKLIILEHELPIYYSKES